MTHPGAAERRPERGVALLLVLLAMSFLVAVGLGLAVSAAMSRMTSANHAEAIALFNAAEAALELAAQELAAVDLDAALAGLQTSVRVDGLPGPRTVGTAASVDLVTLTNQLTCGRVAACSDAQVRQTTTARPWGVNNPRWRLFLHEPLATSILPASAPSIYVVVWIGDDAREDDGDPTRDGAGAGQEGRYIVRARAEAFGSRGGRRAVEAELRRFCLAAAEGTVCLPGSRVQSWRATADVP